jgi:Cu/Ag efflux protein CusF
MFKSRDGRPRSAAPTVALLTLTLLTACGSGAKQTASSTPTPSGPAAAVQTNSYQGVGVVKSLNPKAPAIEIDHVDIEGLMPAMQLEFPVTDANLLNGIAVNDRIDFTVENGPSEMKVTAIKKKE